MYDILEPQIISMREHDPIFQLHAGTRLGLSLINKNFCGVLDIF